MALKQCAFCTKTLPKRSQAQQSYCSEINCQRERRRRWQRAKREADPDYNDNQSRAQQAWRKRNPNYWADYRRAHPEYRDRNRKLQRNRNQKYKKTPIAKMDVSASETHNLSGTYLLTPVLSDGIAKMDSWTVELKFISSSCNQSGQNLKIAKRGRNGTDAS